MKKSILMFITLGVVFFGSMSALASEAYAAEGQKTEKKPGQLTMRQMDPRGFQCVYKNKRLHGDVNRVNASHKLNSTAILGN
jgi:hypothetical protein